MPSSAWRLPGPDRFSIPIFGTLLGWLGVALTGSDTSSNVLFGNLQKITAQKLGLDPILMASANSTGGVMGKMIDAQSIVVAAAATGEGGREGELLRAVFWHSIVLALLVGRSSGFTPTSSRIVVRGGVRAGESDVLPGDEDIMHRDFGHASVDSGERDHQPAYGRSWLDILIVLSISNRGSCANEAVLLSDDTHHDSHQKSRSRAFPHHLEITGRGYASLSGGRSRRLCPRAAHVDPAGP